MNQNRFILIVAVCVMMPLIIGLHLRWKESHAQAELSTSMDIEAVEGMPAEVSGAQTIDTLPQEPTQPEQAESQDSQKRKQVIDLVNEALGFVDKNSFDKAMNAFTHSRDFIRGELYLFVYDTNGFEYANGQDERMIWRNLFNIQDSFGTYIVQEMIKKAKAGGGWITYQWRNSTKVSYIKPFVKDDKEYVIGAGYYPHSKRDLVVGLVRGAVAYFNEVVNQKGFPVDEVFSTLSYPAGRFVMGDLYLYAVSFDGRMMANGDRPGLVGTNVLSVKDAEGKYVNKDIIEQLKKTDLGIWTQYRSKNAVKETYAEKVTDTKGNTYFIACGYYPEAKPERAVELVKSGYEFMKKHGLTAAINEFSSRQVDTYRYGDLYLTVWNMKGVVIANGANLDTIGVNQWDIKDEDGKFYVREIIKKADQGGGWVDFKLKNAFQSIYVEKVDLGTDSFVIGSGLYPISKREMALLLSRSAAGYLRAHEEEEAYSAFSDSQGKFIRGDLYVFVVGFDGICKVWGDTHQLIWRNLLDLKDDAGKPYIQIFINTVKQGPGQVSYKVNGQDRVALLEHVEKDGVNYVLGVSYYL